MEFISTLIAFLGYMLGFFFVGIVALYVVVYFIRFVFWITSWKTRRDHRSYLRSGNDNTRKFN